MSLKRYIINCNQTPKNINGFYMSVLEHEWIIMVEANSAHDIEQLCIDSSISSFNTVNIVPLTNYQDV
ncbi:hypothetical protein NARC_30039 [Candidatus Nitrosocosmicus arcticus]|uniref:DUF3303 domain-containing protein n=1 Tax=Candidatus Nitrosocosmicus arcticus TaxID=2035267 RepID=A0A557SXJ0_9ARCH|nr:hypothetical protein NARC_30039 [Candidatus Nitrosocosmicus arcticus]